MNICPTSVRRLPKQLMPIHDNKRQPLNLVTCSRLIDRFIIEVYVGELLIKIGQDKHEDVKIRTNKQKNSNNKNATTV